MLRFQDDMIYVKDLSSPGFKNELSTHTQLMEVRATIVAQSIIISIAKSYEYDKPMSLQL